MPIDIYTRLSRDVDGMQTATARQEKDCHSFAAIREWTVDQVHCDIDLSAYDRRVERPGYEQLLERVRAHEIDGILVWKLDRLVRRVAEFERLWAACEEAGVFIASATEPIDTRTEIGILIVRILVAFAQMESATMSLRIRRQKQEHMLAGKAAGRRPYGLTADRKQLVDDEVWWVREAAERVLAGDTLRSIVTEWNDRGVPTATGTAWQSSAIRQILLAPATVGDHTYKGQVVVEGAYPAMLDRDTQAEVRSILEDPDRRVARRSGSLLSGLVRCWLCGKTMSHDIGSDGKARYRCQSPPKGCGRNAAHADAVDESVTVRALAHLEMGDFDPADDSTVLNQDSRHVEAQLADVEVAIAELEQDYYVERKVSRAGFDASHRRLTEQSQRLETLLTAGRKRIVRLGEGKDLIRDWFGLSQERKAAVLADLIVKVTIVPVGKGRRRGVAQLPIAWR